MQGSIKSSSSLYYNNLVTATLTTCFITKKDVSITE